MLVLSRKSQESIVIGGNIRVTIIRSRSGVVRLGIDAPADVPVHREEVHQQIIAKNPPRIPESVATPTIFG